MVFRFTFYSKIWHVWPLCPRHLVSGLGFPFHFLPYDMASRLFGRYVPAA